MISKNTYFWKEMMHNQIFPNSRVANHSININCFTAIQWSIETRRLSSCYIIAYLKYKICTFMFIVNHINVELKEINIAAHICYLLHPSLNL